MAEYHINTISTSEKSAAYILLLTGEAWQWENLRILFHTISRLYIIHGIFIFKKIYALQFFTF